MTDKLPLIRSVRPLPSQRLEVTWDTGQVTVIDLGAEIAQGGVFWPLQDSSVFATARLDDRHRVVEWIDPQKPSDGPIVDLDADTLMAMSRHQRFMSKITRLFQPHGG